MPGSRAMLTIRSPLPAQMKVAGSPVYVVGDPLWIQQGAGGARCLSRTGAGVYRASDEASCTDFLRPGSVFQPLNEMAP